MAATDLLYYGVTIFMLSVAVLLCFQAWTVMKTFTLPAGPIINGTIFNQNYSAPSGNTSLGTMNPAKGPDTVFGALDWIIMVLAIAFAIGMFITGYVLPSHPIFTILGIIVIIFWLWLSPILSNTYLEILRLPVLSDAATAFPLINTLMLNLPLIGLFIGIITAILTHGKGPG